MSNDKDTPEKTAEEIVQEAAHRFLDEICGPGKGTVIPVKLVWSRAKVVPKFLNPPGDGDDDKRPA